MDDYSQIKHNSKKGRVCYVDTNDHAMMHQDWDSCGKRGVMVWLGAGARAGSPGTAEVQRMNQCRVTLRRADRFHKGTGASLGGPAGSVVRSFLRQPSGQTRSYSSWLGFKARSTGGEDGDGAPSRADVDGVITELYEESQALAIKGKVFKLSRFWRL